MPKIPTPNLLEVRRADGTFVMDCDSGIALVSVDRRRSAKEARRVTRDSDAEALREAAPKAKPGSN